MSNSHRNDDLDGDTLHEECGVFGILGHPDAATLTALGLHALQHRGQEAAGIVSFDGTQFHSERQLGLVGDHFTDPATVARSNPATPRCRPPASTPETRQSAATPTPAG